MSFGPRVRVEGILADLASAYSFEHQIEAMLAAGSVPFDKQVVIEAKKRPDFVLPSLAHLRKVTEGPGRGLPLAQRRPSASAGSRRNGRWGSDLFLAMVDETIAANAIEDMASLKITLVVPESLKSSKSTEYVRHDNVMNFATFFGRELRQVRMPSWSNI